MERRGFIKGMLASIAGTTAMVHLAQPGEAAALIAQRDLLISQPEPTQIDQAVQAFYQSPPEVYAKMNGQFVSIGYLRDIEVTSNRVILDEPYEYQGSIIGSNPEYVMGLKRITMRFGGPVR